MEHLAATVESLKQAMETGFREGEKRFDRIDASVDDIDGRLEKIEKRIIGEEAIRNWQKENRVNMLGRWTILVSLLAGLGWVTLHLGDFARWAAAFLQGNQDHPK